MTSSSKLVEAETDCTSVGAFLREATRLYADLSGAELRGATGITNEALQEQIALLTDVTMPNASSTRTGLRPRPWGGWGPS